MPKRIAFKSISIETRSFKEKRVSRIHVRGGFSDSIDFSSPSTQMQYVEFGDRTRMMISNKLYQMLEMFLELRKHTPTVIQYKYAPQKEDDQDFCVYILVKVLSEKANSEDGYVYNWRSIFEKLHFVIERVPYNEVLDIVWIVCNWLADNYTNHDNCMYEMMNYVFEREQVDFRFVNGKIVREETDGCK